MPSKATNSERRSAASDHDADTTADHSKGHVLMVSYVYPPMLAGGAVRLGPMSRYLKEIGWEVTVLSGADRPPSGPTWRGVEVIPVSGGTIGGSRRGAPTPVAGVKQQVRLALSTLSSWLIFPDRHVPWIRRAVSAGLAVIRARRPSVIYASYTPASGLIAGYLLSRITGIPLVAEFRDVWASGDLPIFASKLHQAAARRIETAICRHAAKVVGVAPAMAAHLASAHGLQSERTVSITNGFCPEDIERVHDARDAGPRPFELVYSGSVHRHYNFKPVMEAIQSLHSQGVITPDTFQLKVVGNMHQDTGAEFGSRDFVKVVPMVPRELVLDELATADALLLVEMTGYYKELTYAAKVFDYLLTGKPVVALVDPDGNSERLLQAAGVGWIARPDDRDSVCRVLSELLERGPMPAKNVQIDDAPYRAFNRKLLAHRMSEILSEAANSARN